jgi:hypothetical protein
MREDTGKFPVSSDDRLRSRDKVAESLGKANPVCSGKFPEQTPGQTRDQVAEVLGISGRTYEMKHDHLLFATSIVWYGDDLHDGLVR